MKFEHESGRSENNTRRLPALGFISPSSPLLFALAAMLLCLPAYGIQIANEYWISTNTATSGLGTLAQPFDGSTPANFDSQMSSLPANSVMHILPGTYKTGGSSSYNMQDGQRILGSGVGITILQLTNNAPNDTGLLGNNGWKTNIDIEDMTLDSNYTTNSGNVTYGAAYLNGSGIVMRRIRSLNAVNLYSGSSQAGVILGISGYGVSNNSTGNVIEECEVAQFQGGNCRAIDLEGNTGYSITASVLNNRVFLGTNGNAPVTNYTQNAITLESVANSLLEGNHVVGAGIGVLGYGTVTNAAITANSFINCSYGMAMGSAWYNTLTIDFNTIQLANVPMFTYAFGFTDPVADNCTNVLIMGNTVSFTTAPGYSTVGFINANDVNGCNVVNNSVDNRLVNYFGSCTGVNPYNNVDLSGNPLTILNQIIPPNSITRGAVSGTSYSVAYSDRYLGVTSTSGATLTLPAAASYPGKEYIISDEAGTAATHAITIAPTSPSTINGGSSVSISTAYGAKTIITDGANWFAR
jgi:hypothetical protein